ncbi:hypothetical protein [Vibrio sp. TRT 17S01]|uniref:hypothetical protein n=1 Tax=Vibrio sp. TRT 17S01 TaxID=3418505 RepID=UPI003CF0C449
MKQFRSLFKYLLCALFILLVLTFFFWNTSALVGKDLNQGGQAYYDYAPDKQYKAMEVYFHDERPLQLVLDKESRIIYVKKISDEMDVSRLGPIWLGQNQTDTEYTGVSISYMTEIPLPVPFYERWYAWLFMTIRNVDLDKLKMISDF